MGCGQSGARRELAELDAPHDAPADDTDRGAVVWRKRRERVERLEVKALSVRRQIWIGHARLPSRLHRLHGRRTSPATLLSSFRANRQAQIDAFRDLPHELKNLENASNRFEIEVVEGGDHFYSNRQTWIAKKITNWLDSGPSE